MLEIGVVVGEIQISSEGVANVRAASQVDVPASI
jgi:hypothetical protein